MRTKITTIIDITETRALRGADKLLINQQANYNTAIQTIGLRANLIPELCENKVGDVSKFGFGSNIKGKQRYWEFTFEVEAVDALTYDMLLLDFDLVPVITNLNETVSIKNEVFRTNHPNDTNIVFEMIKEC
jgi:hypothetical protein